MIAIKIIIKKNLDNNKEETRLIASLQTYFEIIKLVIYYFSFGKSHPGFWDKSKPISL